MDLETSLTEPNTAHFSSLWFSQGSFFCQLLFFPPQGQIDDKQVTDSWSLPHKSLIGILGKRFFNPSVQSEVETPSQSVKESVLQKKSARKAAKVKVSVYNFDELIDDALPSQCDGPSTYFFSHGELS